MRSEEQIRICIVGNSRLFCQAMRRTLAQESDIDVVSFADSAEQAVRCASDCHVALLDAASYALDDLLELARTIYTECADTKLVAVGITPNANVILRCCEVGICGYISETESVGELLSVVRAAHQNRAHLPSHVVARLIERMADLSRYCNDFFVDAREPGYFFDLTTREREVIHLLAEGLSNREIAQKLIIEYGTVKNHVHSILQKLDVANRQEAAAVYAMMDGSMSSAGFMPQSYRPQAMRSQ